MAETAGIGIGVAVNSVVVPVTGTPEFITRSEARMINTNGGMKAVDSHASLITLEGRTEFWADAATFEDICDLINDTAGALTGFTAAIGTYTQTGCKATNLTLNAAVGEALKGSLSWMATAKGTGTDPGAPASVETFTCISLVAVGIGTTVNASTIDLTVANGVKAVHSMNATGSRLPVALAEGAQAVTFNIKLTDIPSIPADITGALAKIASVTMAFTSTGAAPKTLTITLTNCLPTEQSLTDSIDDILMHGINYSAESVDWAIA